MSSTSSSSTSTSSTPTPTTLQWSAIASLKGNPGNPGTPGATGQRGTEWILGSGAFDPSAYPNAMAGDIYMDTTTGNYGSLSESSDSNA